MAEGKSKRANSSAKGNKTPAAPRSTEPKNTSSVNNNTRIDAKTPDSNSSVLLAQIQAQLALEKKRNEQLLIENTDLKFTVKLAATTPVANNTVKFISVKDQESPPDETSKVDHIKKKHFAEQIKADTNYNYESRKDDSKGKNSLQNTSTRDKRRYEDEDDGYHDQHLQREHHNRDEYDRHRHGHHQHRDDHEQYHHSDYGEIKSDNRLPVVLYRPPPGTNPNYQYGHRDDRYDTRHDYHGADNQNGSRYGYRHDSHENRLMTHSPSYHYNEQFRRTLRFNYPNQNNVNEGGYENNYRQREEQRTSRSHPREGGVIFGNQNVNFSSADIHRFM